MITCLGKSCSFNFMCVSFVKVYQFLCVCFYFIYLFIFFFFLGGGGRWGRGLEGDMWDLFYQYLFIAYLFAMYFGVLSLFSNCYSKLSLFDSLACNCSSNIGSKSFCEYLKFRYPVCVLRFIANLLLSVIIAPLDPHVCSKILL